MSGAWFINLLFILFIVCFFMLHSGIYILECISKYGVGTNYVHISKQLLPKWECYPVNASLIFVLYILIYAVIAFGAVGIICQTLAQFGFLPIYR